MKRNNLLLVLLFIVPVFSILMFAGCKKDDPDDKPDDTPNYPATVKDIDGNTYKTVKIGTQVWMKENLRTTKYNDGSVIPLVDDSLIWVALTVDAFCWYSNDVSNKAKYGALYNWWVIDKGNLCPAGWHVPTNDDWNKLIAGQGGPTFAGDKLKEQGFQHWDSQNLKATNTSGFTALPAGARNGSTGAFGDLGKYTGWWSADFYGMKQFGWFFGLYSQFSTVEVNYFSPKYGYSVRCIMD
jgi:uncharacterized protein (TIGR02145 family)